MTESQHNRRRHQRFAPPAAAGQASVGTLLEVQIKDISLGGMAFESLERPGVGRHYAVRLRLGADCMLVGGRVVWCHLATSVQNAEGELSPVYRAGMRFSPPLSEDLTGTLSEFEQSALMSADEAPPRPELPVLR